MRLNRTEVADDKWKRRECADARSFDGDARDIVRSVCKKYEQKVSISDAMLCLEVARLTRKDIDGQAFLGSLELCLRYRQRDTVWRRELCIPCL